ncbi:dihydrofolate synthase/folylpolyglutamate synthase [Salirhabdus euzebyi]|uniref:Dihydrofolate synthase/folylpolyglutamate synthase n=1 Tax=Salirhabdus euzebyi TaxID=394506 RepID=A0A841PX16_9BACI|nr:folylpolyglutamate synthase/dihydrofolate synthase family protein [Salirhabdus euzebyi]MBB6451926.1 dihydrofolate synthase/folylpolyglutamate synthase [Salirhabdus euzebyi]
MNYQEAVNWIHSRLTFGIKPGIKRMEWFMDKLDHPERKIKAIHIAGTNGKGSTLSFLRHLLQAHGKTVGTFTSPYIVRFNERISMNGEPIHDSEIVSLVEKIKPLAEELEQTELGAPTEFEIITAMAFEYFANVKVDYVLFETGLGGRLDSTNIAKPLLTIITNIGFDHMNILGDTYEQIAFEKAGIIKANIPVITAVDRPEALMVIKNKAMEMNAPMLEYGVDFKSEINDFVEGKEVFSFYSVLFNILSVDIQMKGIHQISNASLALQAFIMLASMEEFDVIEQFVREGLQKTSWPGRFEIINKNPLVILDGAHNVPGLKTLTNTLERFYPNKRKHLIFSAMKDKPLQEMVDILDKVVDHVVFTSFDFERVANPNDINQLSSHPNKQVIPDWLDAFNQVKSTIDFNKEIIIFSGSLYFISTIRYYFDEMNKDMIK